MDYDTIPISKEQLESDLADRISEEIDKEIIYNIRVKGVIVDWQDGDFTNSSTILFDRAIE